MNIIERQIQHLYWRGGFGADINLLQNLSGRQQAIERLFTDAQKVKDIDLIAAPSSPKDLIAQLGKAFFRREQKEQIAQINLECFNRMCETQNALLEKMTLFWTNHFSTRHENAYFCQLQNNTIRRHALGKFGDLLLAIARDPAILKFLNNKQNKKGNPNENFAREVMELFTLGKGNYTENDIKNAARAFTGWSYEYDGTFIIRRFLHDNDTKTFMGKTDNLNGEDIIELILKNKQTARFITRKIYHSFVNEQLDEQRLEQLSMNFYASNYDIEQLMFQIFSADWFYETKNMGNLVKSPIELMVGLTRTFDINFENPSIILLVQRLLAQTLFDPPNVAGWSGGKNWIDSSSILIRLKMPLYIFMSDELDIRAKEDVEDDNETMTEMMGNDRSQLAKRLKKIKANINWQPLIKHFGTHPQTEIFKLLANYLLLSPSAQLNLKAINPYLANTTSTEEYVKIACLRLCSLPEYQLY